ncbi:MAG: serine hydrolase domain-containing protein [Bacteroidales bacterium]
MKYRSIGLIFILLFLLPKTLVTHRVGFNSDFLVPGNIRITNDLSAGRNADYIERLFNSFMRKWNIMGSSVAISVDGRLVFAQGFGYADTEGYIETEPYHRFRIASVSKLITAIAVLKLCEEGILSINDKVFGPDAILNDSIYDNPRDKRVYNITIAHLLGHQGGWSLRYGDHMFITQSVARQMNKNLPLTTSDYVRFALDRRLHYSPGSGRSYSNLGYAILGLVIEKASGMRYEDYCREKIFEPLGILDMKLGNNLESGRLNNEVSYYEQEDAIPKLSVYGTGQIVPASYGGNDIESLGAAGAWVASAPDLLKILLAVDGFERFPDILSGEMIRKMTDIRNGFAPLGWRSSFPSGVWWRTGFFPGTTAMMKRLPNGMAWVVLMNSSAWNGPELTNEINTLMNRILAQVRDWPEDDLFHYSLPLPLKQPFNSNIN